MHQPIIAIRRRDEIKPVGGGGSGAYVRSVLGVDPLHLKRAVADGNADAARLLKVNQIFSAGIGQTPAVVHQILTRTQAVKILG